MAIAATASGTSSRIRSASDDCSTTAPGGLAVRGSVNQIYIEHATPGAKIRITGPDAFSASRAADERGGLVVRGVPAGGAYTVTISGASTSVHHVDVLSPDRAPSEEFYASQHLSFDRTGVDPTDGYLTTRDCTQLSYRVQLPEGPAPANGYDTVITYSGYSPGVRPGGEFDQLTFDAFTKAGYAVVGVNMRGTGCSDGSFDLMEPIVALDGYDAVETIAAQSWVDDVAMVDKSWPGLSQLFVAATRPPHLAAIVPGATVGDFYRDVVYPGGIANRGFGRVWASGIDAINAFPSTNPGVANITDGVDDPSIPGSKDDPQCLAHQALRGQNQLVAPTWASHPDFDRRPEDGRPDSADRRYNETWARLVAPVEKITAPTLLTTSWQDPQVGSRSAELLARFDPATPVRLIGTNGGHEAYYRGDVWREVTRFLCVYLDDSCPISVAQYRTEAPVKILLETNDAGVARSSFALKDLNFGNDGASWRLGRDLRADPPAEADPTVATSFVYQPEHGSWNGPRQGQATFTSPPLDRTVVAAGSGSADLWVSADYTDVDLEVTLSEVRPDGQEVLVQSGWLRASRRAEVDSPASTALRPLHTYSAPSTGGGSPLIPGQPTKMRVEINPFAHAFRAGSQIRLTVSGPGGGANAMLWSLGSVPGPFTVTLAHDASHPSALVLPVVTAPVSVAPGWPRCGDVSFQPCRPVTR